jgi:hypothetical protein
MGRYQADTFQCALLINSQQLTVAYAAAEQLLASSFFISCIKRLWDAVGYFLGRRKQSGEPQPMRASSPIGSVQGYPQPPRCSNVDMNI